MWEALCEKGGDSGILLSLQRPGFCSDQVSFSSVCIRVEGEELRRVPPRAGGVLLIILNAHAVRLHKAVRMQSFLKPASLEHFA